MIKINLNVIRSGQRLDSLLPGATQRIAKGINVASMRLTNAIKINLSLGGSAGATRSMKIGGKVRIYERNTTRHLRSISGKLKSSWGAFPATITSTNVIGRVSTSSRYARIHEFGGLTGRNHATVIPERSYVRPAIKQETPAMAQDVQNAYMEPVRK